MMTVSFRVVYKRRGDTSRHTLSCASEEEAREEARRLVGDRGVLWAKVVCDGQELAAYVRQD